MIYLDITFEPQFSEGTGISGLQDVNFFIGQNNSGKSRLLRFLSQRDSLKVRFGDIDLEGFSREVGNLRNELQAIAGMEISGICGLEPGSLTAFEDIKWLNSKEESSFYLFFEVLRNFLKTEGRANEQSGVFNLKGPNRIPAIVLNEGKGEVSRFQGKPLAYFFNTFRDIINKSLNDLVKYGRGQVDTETTAGTVKEKAKFCDFSIAWMRENAEKWELTKEAENICKKLVGFIEEANRG